MAQRDPRTSTSPPPCVPNSMPMHSNDSLERSSWRSDAPAARPGSPRVPSTSICSFSTDGSSNRSSRRGRTTPLRCSKSRPISSHSRSIEAFANANAPCDSMPTASRMSRRYGFRSAAPASPACDGFCISRSTAAHASTTPRFSMVADLAAGQSRRAHVALRRNFGRGDARRARAPITLRRASNASPRQIAREIVRTPAGGARRRAPARRLRSRALDAGERQARRRNLHAGRNRARRRNAVRVASSASKRKA